MKAIKKPIPIEVEVFYPDQKPWPLQVHERSDKYQVANLLHDSWIDVRPGDYVNVTDKSGRDIYPIDRDTFLRTYDPVIE